MKKIIASLIVISCMMSSVPVFAENNNPEGDMQYSPDKEIAIQQREIYKDIINYQNALNAGKTDEILKMFSDTSYSQWNGTLTADTTEKRRAQYYDLFASEKFETQFAFDTIWVNGDTAVVRTHHHKGSVVTDVKDQRSIIDLNREVFVMKKENGNWKIFLYTFNVNPLQGVS